MFCSELQKKNVNLINNAANNCNLDFVKFFSSLKENYVIFEIYLLNFTLCKPNFFLVATLANDCNFDRTLLFFLESWKSCCT